MKFEDFATELHDAELGENETHPDHHEVLVLHSAGENVSFVTDLPCAYNIPDLHKYKEVKYPCHVSTCHPTGLLFPLLVEWIAIHVLFSSWIDVGTFSPIEFVIVIWFYDQMLASKDEDHHEDDHVDCHPDEVAAHLGGD